MAFRSRALRKLGGRLIALGGGIAPSASLDAGKGKSVEAAMAADAEAARFLASYMHAHNWKRGRNEVEGALEEALLARPDFIEGALAFAVQAIRSDSPDAARALAFSMLGSPVTREAGALVLGYIARWRKLWDFAADNYAMCSDEALIRYQLANALHAFAQADSPRGPTLLDALVRHEGDLASFAPVNDLLRAASFVAMHGRTDAFDRLSEAADRLPMSERTAQEWGNLRREFAAQRDIGEKVGATGYDAVREATKWTGHDGFAHDHSGAIKLGFLNYRNPTRASTNIGDHVQTIGALGQLSAYEFEDLEASPRVREIVEGGLAKDKAREKRRKVERKVEIIPVDRDFSLLQSQEGTVWLPVCGWFAHPIYHHKPTLPFAKNIIPIFMSFHVSNYDIFDDELFAYLKAHEPIGCRDLLTVRSLREQGIEAFFNGCVTLTLGDVYPPFEGERHGRYHGAYNEKTPVEGYETVVHLDARMWERSFDENIAVADDMLRTYHHAEDVITPLLHCLLPCRAMHTPVTFTNKKEGDPRFEGLVDADQAERDRLVARFRAKYQAVFDAIFEGKSREEVFAAWREACREDIERTTAMLDAVEVELPEAVDLGALPGPDSAIVHGTRQSGEDVVDLLFAFDAGYTPHFRAVLHGIVANTERPLRVHVFGRGLADRALTRIAEAYPKVELRHYDMGAIDYGDVKLMSHISVSTMDRLVAPEIITDVRKLVYLDVDILVRGDIGELYDMEFPGHALAGRSGIDRRWREGRIFVYDIPKSMDAQTARELREVVFSNGRSDFVGFNAGVLWLDLEKLREQRMSETTTRIVGRFGLNDQYALNLFTRGDRAELPSEWNHYVIQEHMPDAKLVHFIGPVKPWTPNRQLPFLGEWQAHAREAVRASR